MKNTELSYFLESLQGQPLLDLSPAPGGGITLHFESKYTSGHTDDLTLTPDIDFDGMYTRPLALQGLVGKNPKPT